MELVSEFGGVEQVQFGVMLDQSPLGIYATHKRVVLQHFLKTFVCVLSDLRSELFDAVQFYDSSLGRGCSPQVLFFFLLLLFPGSLPLSAISIVFIAFWHLCFLLSQGLHHVCIIICVIHLYAVGLGGFGHSLPAAGTGCFKIGRRLLFWLEKGIQLLRAAVCPHHLMCVDSLTGLCCSAGGLDLTAT